MAENDAYEAQRKLVQAIRKLGSTMNMQLPVARQKSDAIRLKALCEELITALGGE